MSSDGNVAVSIQNVGKYFEIYRTPRHRLLQIMCRGRKKFYEEYWALADIDLKVEKGCCIGILGRNGAGKSTLLQIIAGTLAPSRGEVKVNGRLAALLELGSGFNPEFTGRDNVLLNASILGLTPEEIDARYDSIVKFADIGDFINMPVKTYSSGMTLRLAFAVMANVDAEILIIDEALAVGDAFFTQKCMRFLRDFIKEHTVIFVSHDTNAILSLCDRAVLLENGRIKLAGSPKEVSQKYLEEIYAERQGEERMAPAAEIAHTEAPLKTEGMPRDMRAELFNSSTLRNDLEVFPFNREEEGFGARHGSVEDAWLANAAGERYSWIVGGERVFLHAVCKAHEDIQSPILGFLVCDAYGQKLFGDNTYLAYCEKPLFLRKGDTLHVVFEFQMPIMAPGEYYVTVALAEGTPEKHVQHHWLHEAFTFISHTSSVSTGLIGIPMLSITMEAKQENAANAGE